VVDPVPQVVAERIRRPVPVGLSVLPESLPVVSFVGPNAATLATLSLTPSSLEFPSTSGAPLLGGERRLASLVSPGVDYPRHLYLCSGRANRPRASFLRRCWSAWWSRTGSPCTVSWATATSPWCCSTARRWSAGCSMPGWSVCSTRTRSPTEPATETADPRLPRGFRGVTFLGWNWPLAGPIAAAGRRRLARWVGRALREWVFGTLVTERTRAPGGEDPGPPSEGVNGYVPVGTTVDGAAGLERLLAHRAEASNQATVGHVGTYGGSPVIIVRLGSGDEFVLNRDTKRAAVLAFPAVGAIAGSADRLPWHVTANSSETVNRVSYRADDRPTPGWYAYLRTSSPEPQGLG
jgi:hypothetical protein